MLSNVFDSFLIIMNRLSFSMIGESRQNQYKIALAYFDIETIRPKGKYFWDNIRNWLGKSDQTKNSGIY